MGRFGLEDLALTISLRAAREYLSQRGWRIREEGLRLVCEGPLDDEGRPILQFLPPDESYSDYPLRLEDLIATLSALEERPAVEIAAEMARSAETPLRQTGSLADDLAAELSRSSVRLVPGTSVERGSGLLAALLVGGELAIGELPLDGFPPRQQAALLAARFARLVVPEPASELLLLRLCNRILAEADLILRVPAEELGEFWNVVAADNPDAPDAALLWIEDHAKEVRSTTARKKDRPAVAKGADPSSDSGRPAD